MARKHRNPHTPVGKTAQPPAARPDATDELEAQRKSQDQEQSQQRQSDLVDEESMESFPASDPPSHTRSHS